MPLKTGDNALGKHLPSTEKNERIVTATINFLSSEQDICSLLHHGCFGSKINFELFSLQHFFIMVFFKNSPLRENG